MARIPYSRPNRAPYHHHCVRSVLLVLAFPGSPLGGNFGDEVDQVLEGHPRLLRQWAQKNHRARDDEPSGRSATQARVERSTRVFFLGGVRISCWWLRPLG